jgi:hypothetical protein
VSPILSLFGGLAFNAELLFSEESKAHAASFGSKKRRMENKEAAPPQVTRSRLDELWATANFLFLLANPDAQVELTRRTLVIQFRKGTMEMAGVPKPVPLKDRAPSSVRIEDFVQVLRDMPPPSTAAGRRSLFLRQLYTFWLFRPSCAWAILFDLCQVAGELGNRVLYLALVDRKMRNDHAVNFLSVREHPDPRFCSVKSFMAYAMDIGVAIRQGYEPSCQYFPRSGDVSKTKLGHRVWPNLSATKSLEKIAQGNAKTTLRKLQQSFLEEAWIEAKVPEDLRRENAYITRSLGASHLRNMGWHLSDILERGNWTTETNFNKYYYREEQFFNKLSAEELATMSVVDVMLRAGQRTPTATPLSMVEVLEPSTPSTDVTEPTAAAASSSSSSASVTTAPSHRALPPFIIKMSKSDGKFVVK